MLGLKIQVKIEKIEGDRVFVAFEGGNATLPKSNLDPKLKTGDTLYLALLTKEEVKASESEIAKAVLSEVLKGSNG